MSQAQSAVAGLAKLRDGELWQQADREPHAATWYVEACSSAQFFGLEIDGQFAEATSRRLGKLATQKRAPAGASEAALRCAWSLVQHAAPERGDELAAKIAAAPPRADAIDYRRWLDGSHALFQAGGEAWQVWQKALLAVLLPAQGMDGSWPAPAATAGAEPREASPLTCATARACLLLVTPRRFTRRAR